MSLTRTMGALLLLGLPALCQAQFAAVVHDPINTAQSIINTGRQLLQEIQIYERQFEQLRAAWTQIENQVHQLEAALKNLQRIPENLNFLDILSDKGAELITLLNATEGLSYTLDQATQQFSEHYTHLVCQSTTAEIQAAYAQMRQLQMGTTKSAVQLQSIQTHVLDAFARLCSLIAGSVQAQGNLDVLQIQAQQTALVAQQQAQADAAAVASARVQALREAERMVKEEMRRCQQERFFRTGDTQPYVPDARLNTLHVFTW
jgi:P-type conjugative transfer protein TrbJ